MKSKMGILSGKSALKIVLRFAVAVYISACSECWCRLATIFFKIAGTLSLLLQAIRIRDLVKMNSKSANQGFLEFECDIPLGSGVRTLGPQKVALCGSWWNPAGGSESLGWIWTL